MTDSDIKVMLLNAVTFTISLAKTETILTIAMLLISIGYTAERWYHLRKKK